jgi:hypothetical protein
VVTETVSKLLVDEATVALEARETLCSSLTQGTNSNLILGATSFSVREKYNGYQADFN